jgi:hypothetical protein
MVETLNIKATEDSPEVVLNSSKGFMSFEGTSWLEDAYSFYEPLYQWVKEYFDAPEQVTDIEFKFIYLNTSSAKQIARLVSIINNKKGGHIVRVKWFYEKDDNEMLKIGKKYSGLLSMGFQFIETEPQLEKEEEEGVYNII